MAVPTFKSFVSEKEVEEVRKKRQEEWEKVRKPSDPLERPEPEVDNRTLYERLKQQKDTKQEEWDEKHKFKNMIYKGLDDEESVFLSMVADKKAEHEADIIRAEISEVTAYREAVSRLHEEAAEPAVIKELGEGLPETRDRTVQSGVKKNKSKSQLSLIAGSIKTKRKRPSSEASDSKEAIDSKEASDSKEAPVRGSDKEETSPDKRVKLSSPPATNKNTLSAVSGPQPGALSGLLAAYSSSESDSDS